jgi:hypothetical protein
MALTFTGHDNNYDGMPVWAKEETQLQVLSVLQRDKGISGKSTKELEKLTKATTKEAKASEKAAAALAEVANFSGTLAGTMATTRGEFKDLIPVVDAFGQIFKKVAGSIMDIIPFVGDLGKGLTDLAGDLAVDVFSFIATSADELIDSYRDIAQQGITFEGNLQNMQKAGAGAIMSLDELDNLFQQAIPTLATFGNATKGAEVVLGNLSKLWVADGLGEQLVRMGFSIAQVNETTVGFYNLLAKSGQAMLLQAGNEELLSAATGRYTKNLLIISKITGRQREELEADIRAQMEQGNIQAALAQLEGKAGADSIVAFQQLQGVLTTMSPQLATAFGSIATLGVASAESEALLANLGGSTRDLMTEFGEGFREGTLSKEDANRLTQAIMEDMAEGFLDPNNLQLAQMGTDVTGGFVQMLAKNMETALPFAQSIKAGASLEEMSAQITKEMENQQSQAATLADAQLELAKFPIALQAAIVSTDGFAFAITKVAETTQKFTEVLSNILMGKGVSGFVGDDRTGNVNKPPTEREILAEQMIEGKLTGESTNAVDQLKFAEAVDFFSEGGQLKQLIMTEKNENKKSKLKDMYDTAVRGNAPQEWKNIDDIINFVKSFGFDAKDLGIKSFQLGTKGIVDFGAGALALLHGKEAVIPAPEGLIPVDLGDSLKPLEDLLANITNKADGGTNLLAQDGVNSVQSKQVVSKLEEMVGVLKTIADGQHIGTSTTQRELKKLGNFFAADLFR